MGCGDRPTGDVNCDLYVSDTFGHRLSVDRFVFDPRKVSNFVSCDASHLPFREKIFGEVCCFDVIEHVVNPWLLLKELYRVAASQVIIKCPHRYGERIVGSWKDLVWRKKHHISQFSSRWFYRAAQVLGCSCKVEVVQEVYFPNHFLRLLTFPLEMQVTLIKVEVKRQG